MLGGVAALLSSQMNGLLPFESTTEQTTETMPPSQKTITAANNQKNDKLKKAATLLKKFPGHGSHARPPRENNISVDTGIIHRQLRSLNTILTSLKLILTSVLHVLLLVIKNSQIGYWRNQPSSSMKYSFQFVLIQFSLRKKITSL